MKKILIICAIFFLSIGGTTEGWHLYRQYIDNRSIGIAYNGYAHLQSPANRLPLGENTDSSTLRDYLGVTTSSAPLSLPLSFTNGGTGTTTLSGLKFLLGIIFPWTITQGGTGTTTTSGVRTVLSVNNTDNTSDVNKPVSSAQQTAFDLKEPLIASGITAQYWRGDKTWQTLDKIAVGLGNVLNLDTTNPANITQTSSYRFVTDASTTQWNAKQNAISLGTTAQYFRGDLSLATFPTSFQTVIATGTLTRAAATASGSQTITLSFRPAYVIFSAVDNVDSQVLSDGIDDGTQPVSTASFDVTLLATLISSNSKSHAKSIYVVGALGNGHSANISTVSSTGFTLNWTKIGSGRDITVKYFAVY